MNASPPSAGLAATGWETASPDAAGFKPGLSSEFERLQASGQLPGLHGVVAARGGRIVFERYLDGQDAAWGTALGEIAMERAEDRYRYVLSRPILGDPGRGWTCSGGNVALPGKIMEASGCSFFPTSISCFA